MAVICTLCESQTPEASVYLPVRGQTYVFLHASLSRPFLHVSFVCRRDHKFLDLFLSHTPVSLFFLLPIPAAAAPLPILCRNILCVHVYTVLLWTRARTFHHRSRRRVLRRHGPIAQRRKPDAMASSSSLVRVKIPGTHWYVPETTRLILSRVVSNVILVYRIGRCARRSLLSLRCV